MKRLFAAGLVVFAVAGYFIFGCSFSKSQEKQEASSNEVTASITDPVQEPEAVKEDVPTEQATEPKATEPEVVNPSPTPAPPVSSEKLPDVDVSVPFVVPVEYWEGAMLLYRAGIGFNFPTGERVAITSTRDVYVPPGVSFGVNVPGDSGGIVRLPAVAFAFDVVGADGKVFLIIVPEEDYTSSRSGWIRSGEPIVTVTGGGSKIRERYDPREADVVVSVFFGGGNREKLLDFLKISDDKFSALTIEEQWRLLYERDDPAYLRKRLGELFDLFSGK